MRTVPRGRACAGWPRARPGVHCALVHSAGTPLLDSAFGRLATEPPVPGSARCCRSSRRCARGQVPRPGRFSVLLRDSWVLPLHSTRFGSRYANTPAFSWWAGTPLGRSPDRSFHGPDRRRDLSAVGERPRECGAPDGSRGAAPLSPVQTSRQFSRSASRVSLRPSPCRPASAAPLSLRLPRPQADLGVRLRLSSPTPAYRSGVAAERSPGRPLATASTRLTTRLAFAWPWPSPMRS